MMLNKAIGIILGVIFLIAGYVVAYGPKGDYLFSVGLVLIGSGLYLIIKSVLGGVRIR
jgi:hypothetical protein